MKILVQIVRMLMGALFIFSGLVKLNDPMGFGFKLEEYCMVFGTEFMMPLALSLAVFICIFEIVVGLALLLGIYKKWALWGLLAMMIFFTFLTFYSAYFNKVTDCGCFGDAIPLTPWESFTKDVILSIAAIFLFIGQKHIQPIIAVPTARIILTVSIALQAFMAYWVLNHLPLIDFRAYKVGTDIVEDMSTPEGAPVDEFEITWTYKVDGFEKEFSTEEEPWNIEGAEYVSRDQKLVKEGYHPPIHDFTMTIDDVDYTETLMQEDELFLLVMYRINETPVSPKLHKKVNDLVRSCDNAGVIFLGMSSSGYTQIEEFRHKVQAQYQVAFCDETTLKTIVRSNPGLVYIKNGLIAGKWHYNDLPKDLEAARKAVEN